MQKYLISIDLEENIPSYTVIVSAETLEGARVKAQSILENDYPEYTNCKIYVDKIDTLEDVCSVLEIS